MQTNPSIIDDKTIKVLCVRDQRTRALYERAVIFCPTVKICEEAYRNVAVSLYRSPLRPGMIEVFPIRKAH